ncbi:MAG: LacI family DNA-binding transcriptional regulator [Pseudotabrizicola sp.]|uniref:LacI family DNA-binding transcriptional regulator n=1 Tax=Pseudotabrizicola sp. TaxID=2939647 RepID=UPI002724C119|nr:LacI family DNA-binding transcriptional regulator [Pseudotabrizicola sp.]MDO8882471.1 LacI family DNA-binding transcriptional regulator [Pseudotabrizicola sp.]MDP2080292.1 LacI family DNA-binding transcriptional regulator [Pseudotabrizicola sp.]MDZ7575377.1 LacI family DNA-binding transcriptional regulator [Pseudotabrizicola sp.]
MQRPTIADLAQAAGVSVATVDRVLNGRLKVREETSRKVSEAAERIGYHAAHAIRQRIYADLPEYHLGVVLQKERHAYYQEFASELTMAASQLRECRMRITILFSQSAEPAEVANLLLGMSGKVHAIAATGLDHHDVTNAVATLRHKDIPTFSLLSDFAQGVREAYFGTNNMKVGRNAAWLLSKFAPRPGKVLLFIGGHRYHGHSLRETGFRAYFREYAPEFEVLDAVVNLETRQLTREALLGAISRHPDLVALYCAGGGMEGAIAALREVDAGESIACLVNELTPESRQALLERRISGIFQTPLKELCRELMATVVHTIENGMAENPGQRFIAPILWTPESI